MPSPFSAARLRRSQSFQRLTGISVEPLDADDPPVAHEDAIRLAHKSLTTAKAFMTEGMSHHAKALSLLDGVMDALDADPASDPPDNPDPDPEKAAQLRRAAELRAKHKPA